MKLTDGVVTLKPFDSCKDREYLCSLIRKHDRIVPEEIIDKIDHHGRIFWNGYTRAGIKGGVIYLSYYSEFSGWVLHAQRDDRMLAKNWEREDWSLRAARLVIDYFFKAKIGNDRLYAFIAKWRKRAKTILDDLGFVPAGEYSNRFGDFQLFVKARA